MPAISGGQMVSHTGEPAVEARAVTKSDATTLEISTEAEPEKRYPRALYIGGAGDVAVVMLNDAAASPR